MRATPRWLSLLVLTCGTFAVHCGDPGEDPVVLPNTTSGGTAGAGGTAGSGSTAPGGGSNPTGGAATGGSTPVGGGSGSGGGTSPGGARAACTAPASYRNLFVEILGKTEAEVDTKVSAVVQQLFHGSGDQPIYYESGADEAYITDVNNNDVRSEGQSYGMTVAVAMNMKDEFDKLWRFAVNRMRQSNGLFAWQLTTSGTVISPYAAPDGEEYFAMALLLASRRWGDDTGTHYGNEAKAVMQAIATQGDFNTNPPVVTFGPTQPYTDASYVLPLFYSEWACVDSAHASLWQSATTYARTFFEVATHASTGLAPERSEFDGSPRSGSNFESDAWRVPMNIMMDYNLNGADPWQATYAARQAAFWNEKGLASYGNKYTLAGEELASGHGAGMVGANAMLAFALPAAEGRPFLQAAWDTPAPTGQYRYYDGCLLMLSLMHLSGKFDLYY